MALFSNLENKVIDEKYILALKDDDIFVEGSVLGNAKQGKAEAIYKIGCEYASKKNTEIAILWLGTSAALGFYESQLQLGDLLKEDDPECAAAWYKRAKSNGILHACTRIGDALLEKGRNKQAEKEYIKATEHGDPYSQNHLGVFYRDGCYSKKGLKYGVNIYAAFDWFQKAADQNFAEAQYNIAQLYEEGWGTDKDGYEALYWYEKSRAGGQKVDDCIKRLNKKGYFYFPQENASPSATKIEATEATADANSRIDQLKLKNELQSLESFNPEENSVTVNINDLVDMIESTLVIVTK